MCTFWGPDHVMIHNDAYTAILGRRRASGGRPAPRAWPAETWETMRAILTGVLATGESFYAEDQLFAPARHGYVEEAYFTHTVSALQDRGEVAGLLATATESTDRVLAARRMDALRALAAAAAGADTYQEACERAARVLDQHRRDVPFALFYLGTAGGRRAALTVATGLEAGSEAAPYTIDLEAPEPPWPLAAILRTGATVAVDDLRARFDLGAVGPWREAPTSARLFPLQVAADSVRVGVLVLGMSPRLARDGAYGSFLELVARQVNASLAEARARQMERHRLVELSELDRTKTEFFSNVSHEFRTPLTLLLAPLEELLRRREALPAPLGQEVEVASRNARRLLGIVDTLLDFSQMEAGRLSAEPEPTDLAAFTAEIASVFRSAAERAGLELVVECEPAPEAVWVDRGMWEKIVSNLLSNALKFTFDGRIVVRLAYQPQHAELTVRDTGVGIPPEELPHVFKRFHRVKGTRARTREGSGIGLALVHGLVRRHGGRVRVQSVLGRGTTFTVWIPLRPLTSHEMRPTQDLAQDRDVAETLADEASRWSLEGPASQPDVLDVPLGPPGDAALPARASGARILVVDDNADLRDYLRRLLSARWQVDAARDGREALERAAAAPPDLILTDVMMPGLDGFGLLREVRSHARLRETPVVLVTARAGEEAAIEGLLAGADDYLVKPFSARELIARVGGQLELSRMRRRVAELNAFIVRFSDAVRDLADPSLVAETACRMVAEHLGVDGVLWAEVDSASRECVVDVEVLPAGRMGVRGRHPLEACDEIAALCAQGRPFVVEDVRSDPSIPAATRNRLASLAAVAAAVIPVLKEGSVRAALAIGHGAPRRFTADELALLAGIAGHCWAEVERARAEAALRASEARLAADLAGMRRLYALHVRLATETDLAAALDEILAAACEFTGADQGAIRIFGDDGQRLELVAHRGGLETAGAGREAVGDGMRGVRSTPMVSRKGEKVGVLSLQLGEPHRASDEALRLVDLLAWTAVDFVERHRAAAALGDSEARLRQVLETEAVGVLFFDSTGTLVNANDAFLQMTGYTREQVQRRELTWRTMTPPEWMAESEAQMARFAVTGRVGPYRKEYLRADGSRLSMVFAGRDMGDGTIAEYCVDVTDLASP